MARHIYLRGDNWWFQFRWPADVVAGMCAVRPLERFSLDTTNEQVALLDAERFATERRLQIKLWRAHKRSRYVHTPIMGQMQQPGTTNPNGDGSFTVATEEWLVTMRVNTTGIPEQVGETRPNLSIQVGTNIVRHWATPADALVEDEEQEDWKAYSVCRQEPMRLPGNIRIPIDRSKPLHPPKKISEAEKRDAEILDLWIEGRGIRNADAKEARKSLDDLRRLFPGVTLESASFTQAQALGRYYQDSSKNLFKVAQKKVRWLSTAIKYSGNRIEPQITRKNVFVGACPKPRAKPGEFLRKSIKRIRFDDAETARLIKHIPFMREDHQLITLLCVTTGMRPVEACSIVGEQEIDGLRCCVVGAKLDDEDDIDRSRTIPFPTIVLPYLPPRIEGQLFPEAPLGNVELMRRFMTKRSNELNAYVRAVVTVARNKSFYSLRHRAISVLTEKCCPTDIHLEIVGHEEHNGVHRSYIHGKSVYPRSKIFTWMSVLSEDLECEGLKSQ